MKLSPERRAALDRRLRAAKVAPTEDQICHAMETLERRADRAEEGVRDLLSILTEYVTTEAPKRTARAVARRLKAERKTVTKLQAQTEHMNQVEVAALLGVCTKSVHRWCRTRGLPVTRIGRTLRFSRTEVIRWRDTQGRRPGRSRFGAKPHAPTPVKMKTKRQRSHG